MAKAKKLPSGNWRVQVYAGRDENGKKKYESFTDPNKATAQLMAAQFQAGLRIEAEEQEESVTFDAALEAYIKSRDAVLSPSTVREYKQVRRNFFTTIKNIPVSQIAQKDVQEEINEISKNHAPKTVRNAHGLISAVLRETRPDFVLRTNLPKKKKPEIKIPDSTGMIKITNAVKGTPMELPVMLALCLGLRRSEICGLTWDCVDLKKKQITINKALVIGTDGPTEKQPKTYAGYRTLMLPKRIVEILESVPRGKEEERVVQISYNQVGKRFKQALQKHGLDIIRFHDLRHAHASVMLALNVPDKYAMEFMGHSTNSTLKTVYQHTMDSEKELLNQRVTGYFDKAFSAEISHGISHENPKT